jgi:predicted ATPase
LHDPGQVPAVVAAGLGVREQPGVPAAVTLARVLARQQLLLVLDNCEHVISTAAGLCAELVAACDDLRVLATSREALQVAGEARYRLGPLAVPDPGDLADVARTEAVVLFVDRAQQADAHFVLDGRTGPQVARLVARLDGMPLAIELAAARVEALGVGQPPWSGATSCWMSRSGGPSGRCRCFPGRSPWRAPRRWPGRAPGWRCCAWWTARC